VVVGHRRGYSCAEPRAVDRSHPGCHRGWPAWAVWTGTCGSTTGSSNAVRACARARTGHSAQPWNHKGTDPHRSADSLFVGPFAYARTSRPILDNFQLEIPAGQSLAIVGANGAGKTTLLKLLLRLYEPTAGAILVDGTPVAALDLSAWRRAIAVIFQDFVRYELTARENIGFGSVALMESPRAEVALHRAAERDWPTGPDPIGTCWLRHHALAPIRRRRGPLRRTMAANRACPCAVCYRIRCERTGAG